METNNNFINEGIVRLKAYLSKTIKGSKYKELLKEFPNAIDIIAEGYISFALSTIYPHRVEVDGEPREYPDGTIPLPILIALDWWEICGDWSLSILERNYLTYLGHKAWFWDEGFYIPENQQSNLLRYEALLDSNNEQDKEAKDINKDSTPEEVELFIRGRINKYYRALRLAWEEGKSYEDMLAINPDAWGLPDLGTLKGVRLPTNRETAALFTLGEAYHLYARERNGSNPTLRRIAEQMGVPYSKMLLAYNYIREAMLIDSRRKQEESNNDEER